MNLDTVKLSMTRLLNQQTIGQVIIVILWGTSISSIFANAIYHNPYPTIVDYAIVFGICLAGGALMLDIAKALMGFLAAMGIGLSILIVLSTLPASNTLPLIGVGLVQGLMLSIIFQSVFPFPFFMFLIGSMIGALAGENYL
jgi:hypothetical protein